MDFIDWCHRVLRTLEGERFNPHLSDHALQNILFGATAQNPDFHFSDFRHAMFHALDALSDAGLAQKEKFKVKITPRGREVLADPTEYWTRICGQEVDPEEEVILRLVNRLSPQQETDPECVWLKDVEVASLLAEFGVDPPPGKTNEHLAELNKYVYELPRLLAERVFLKTRSLGSYCRKGLGIGRKELQIVGCRERSLVSQRLRKLH